MRFVHEKETIRDASILRPRPLVACFEKLFLGLNVLK